MTSIVFWSAAALVVYTYALFPAILLARAVVSPRRFAVDDIEPTVTMIVAAYNEAASIGAKLENALSLDYPAQRLEIIVASDGSTDGTNEIVQSYASRGIRLIRLPRGGKVTALNAAAAVAAGEILVFSDANSMYARDAVRVLVRPFADAAVGGVAGDQRYLAAADSGPSSEGERIYWNGDRMVKRLQSRAGSVTSATGAIYAIRRSLFRTVPIGVMDDFVISTRVVAQGYRLVFAPDAIAYEPVAGSSNVEFRRKVRNTALGLQGVLAVRELLNPYRYGFYALQLFSHKVARRLVVFPLIALAVTSPLLWNHGRFYQIVALAQLGFYGAALAGFVLARTPLRKLKAVTVPFYFCMVYVAVLVAILHLIRGRGGRRITSWETQREEFTGERRPDRDSIPSGTTSL